MDNIGLIMEYEDILLGKRKDFSSEYMGKTTINKDIQAILKYVYEDLLHWTPQTIRDYNNPVLIEKLHLTRPVRKIDFPPELSPEDDLFYIAKFLYPDIIKCSKKNLTLRVYERVISGDLLKYPKKFFSDAEGELNLNICFQYAVSQHMHVKSIEELYDFFADKEKGIEFLKENRLHNPFLDYYEYPIDLLHASLPTSQKNLLYYVNGRLKSEISVFKKGVNNADKN